MKNTRIYFVVFGIMFLCGCGDEMKEPSPLRVRAKNLTNHYIDSLSIGVMPEVTYKDVPIDSETEYTEVELAWGTVSSIDVFLDDTLFQFRSFDVLNRMTEGDFTYELFIDSLAVPPNLFYKVISEN